MEDIQPDRQTDLIVPRPERSLFHIILHVVVAIAIAYTLAMSMVALQENPSEKAADLHWKILQNTMKISELQKATIRLDLAEKGFQSVAASAGVLLISVQEVTPYLDGQKIKLHIGNPSTASYQGLVLHLEYGVALDYNTMQYDAWKKTLKTKDISLTDTISSGKWNPVTFTIAPASPADLRHFSLSITTNTLQLLGPE